MKAPVVMHVDFYEDVLQVVDLNGEPYAVIRPISDSLGLSWPAQYRKLTDNQSRWDVVMLATPSAGGMQRQLCIPVRKLPGFLYSIDPGKIAPELRERVELYQRERDELLYIFEEAQQKATLVERLLEDLQGRPHDFGLRYRDSAGHAWRLLSREQLAGLAAPVPLEQILRALSGYGDRYLRREPGHLSRKAPRAYAPKKGARPRLYWILDESPQCVS